MEMDKFQTASLPNPYPGRMPTFPFIFQNSPLSLTLQLRDISMRQRYLEGEAGAEGDAEGVREDRAAVGVEAVEEGKVHGAAG